VRRPCNQKNRAVKPAPLASSTCSMRVSISTRPRALITGSGCNEKVMRGTTKMKKGVTTNDKVAIMGGSYGGYATLAGVAFTPTVYAAAVAYVPPSNLITLLDAIPPYWEAGRRQLYARMADPTTPAGRALLIAESPLTRAQDIVTPLLVVQGKNDPRVNIRESNQIVAAVRDHGKPVEYLVAPDEGHGFQRPINNLAMVTAMEAFYAHYLGGRQQTEVPTDVAERLAVLRVDPKTVSGAVTLDGALKSMGSNPRK